MNNNLNKIFQAFLHSSNEEELRLIFMDFADEYFGAKHCGFYLLDENYVPIQAYIKGLPDSFIDYYEQIGRSMDSILNFVIERHVPIHEQFILTERCWKQSSLYRHVSSRYDQEHIMTGPIIGNGRLIGTLNLARGKKISAFTVDDLMDFNAICTHLSTRLTAHRSVQPKISGFLSKTSFTSLTKREQEIATFVAKGLTNTEIGTKLWISENGVKQALKRIFRKLDVSSRTELIAKLFLRT
ncbi:helix-turn-helix transcriptional regulator [Halomicronema hongdechloris]|nr:LuxR C-terminal-related transcriptional regulator [Halomicronema hongdechloris]